MKRRVAILISGRGSNMAALIDATRAEDFPAEIVVVISNRSDAGGLEKAAASGIPTMTIESKPFGKDRAAFVRGSIKMDVFAISYDCPTFLPAHSGASERPFRSMI